MRTKYTVNCESCGRPMKMDYKYKGAPIYCKTCFGEEFYYHKRKYSLVNYLGDDIDTEYGTDYQETDG